VGLLGFVLVLGCAWVLVRALRTGLIWGLERVPVVSGSGGGGPLGFLPVRVCVVSRVVSVDEFWRWFGVWVFVDHVLLVLVRL
jgi:hypothetical protein